MTRAKYYLSLLQEHDVADVRRCRMLAVGLAIAWAALLAFGGCYSVTAPNAATGGPLTGTWVMRIDPLHYGQWDTLTWTLRSADSALNDGWNDTIRYEGVLPGEARKIELPPEFIAEVVPILEAYKELSPARKWWRKRGMLERLSFV